MSKSKEQCMLMIAEKFDEIKTDFDAESQVMVLEALIKDISDSEYGFLYSYDNKNNKLKFLNNGTNFDMEGSILEEVLSVKRGFFDNYVVSHKNFNQKIDNPLNIRIKSLLVVPIFDRGKETIVGFLLALNSVDYIQEFKRYDVRCLGFLNSQALKTIELVEKEGRYNSRKFLNVKINTESSVEETIVTKKVNDNENKEREALLSKLALQDEKIKELERQIESEKESRVHNDILVIDEALYPETKERSQLKDILEFLTNEVTYLAHEEHKIYLFLEIIKNSLHNKEQLNFINHMLEKSQLIHKLANDLYTREKMPLLLEKFNLFQMVYDLSNLYGQTLREENVTFNVFVDPHIPSLLISEMLKIKSLMIHLLNNVYGLTNDGGMIELSIHYIEESEILNIEVKGVVYAPKNSIKNFFQPTRVSHSLTSSDSGLGLSVSSNIINILGGKLKLLNQGDKEHSFLALLPVQMVKEEKKSFVPKKITKIAILMEEQNEYATQNLIRYCMSFGLSEKDISIFTNYKKMNNIKFSHLFCFENMLSTAFNSNHFSSIVILKYSTLKVEKDYFNNKNTYELYINSYYGLELQELLFPDKISEKILRKTLLTEDSFLNKFNNMVKKLKSS